MGMVLPLAAVGGAEAGGLSTALSIAGTAVSAFGALSSGSAEAAQANYAAQVARNNQIIANQNANYAAAAGEQRAFQEAQRERQRQGQIVAGLAASGLDVNSGSAADIRTSQAGLGIEDVETTRQEAALRAYGYRTQAANFGAEAQLDRAQARFSEEAGWLKGLGGVLSGAKGFFGGGNTIDTSSWSDWSPRGA